MRFSRLFDLWLPACEMFMLNERSFQLFRDSSISAHVLNTKAYQNGIGWQLFLALSETFIEILDNLFDRAAYC